MINIRPISDLRNNFNDIAKICHEYDEPVYITKNGEENLVIMSTAVYERQQALLELYQKLAVAEEESANNSKTKTHEEIMEKLRGKINAV